MPRLNCFMCALALNLCCLTTFGDEYENRIRREALPRWLDFEKALDRFQVVAHERTDAEPIGKNKDPVVNARNRERDVTLRLDRAARLGLTELRRSSEPDTWSVIGFNSRYRFDVGRNGTNSSTRLSDRQSVSDSPPTFAMLVKRDPPFNIYTWGHLCAPVAWNGVNLADVFAVDSKISTRVEPVGDALRIKFVAPVSQDRFVPMTFEVVVSPETHWLAKSWRHDNGTWLEEVQIEYQDRFNGAPFPRSVVESSTAPSWKTRNIESTTFEIPAPFISPPELFGLRYYGLTETGGRRWPWWIWVFGIFALMMAARTAWSRYRSRLAGS